MRTLYVSDLDGTLLHPDARLSARSEKLLNDAIAGGKLFTIATARTPATVAPIFRNVRITLPAIVMTGAALWDSETGIYSRKRLMNPEDAGRVLEVYRRNETPTFVYFLTDNKIRIRHIGELSPLHREFMEERAYTPYKELIISADGSSIFPEVPEDIILLYSMLPNDIGSRTYEETRALPGIRAQFYHDIYGEKTAILEAFSSEATKAKAMRALAKKIGAEKIVAFGDNINDLPMMEEADLAVAVENALPEVKRAADIVIGPNTEDSVARFIAEGRGD